MDNLEFSAYVDSDWAGEIDRQSIGGLVCRLGRQGACHWKCAKQTIVAKSSSEAELIALADHSDILMVLRLLLGELGMVSKPSIVYEDNSAAIDILNDTIYNGKTKHVDIRLKSLRERHMRDHVVPERAESRDTWKGSRDPLEERGSSEKPPSPTL